jgi:acetyltransferase-like isoleucine patch superfamily enzyme
MINHVRALIRRIRTMLMVAGKHQYLHYGKDLHVGAGTRLWAPNQLNIGDYVYIGKQVHIEADCNIGNFVLIANRAAIVGRHDHDFRAVGFPVRFAPWIGSSKFRTRSERRPAIIENDVWVGYGAIILTGVHIGRGAIIGAGSLVTQNVSPYTISTGVPSKEIGRRFSSNKEIEVHEKKIQNGRFQLSERGYDACHIEPGRVRQ